MVMSSIDNSAKSPDLPSDDMPEPKAAGESISTQDAEKLVEADPTKWEIKDGKLYNKESGKSYDLDKPLTPEDAKAFNRDLAATSGETPEAKGAEPGSGGGKSGGGGGGGGKSNKTPDSPGQLPTETPPSDLPAPKAEGDSVTHKNASALVEADPDTWEIRDGELYNKKSGKSYELDKPLNAQDAQSFNKDVSDTQQNSNSGNGTPPNIPA